MGELGRGDRGTRSMREAPKSGARSMTGASPWCVAGDPLWRSKTVVYGKFPVRVTGTNSRVIWKRLTHIMSCIGQQYRNLCPFCNCCVPESITHLLVECSCWDHYRMRLEADNIPEFFEFLRDGGC